MKPIEEIEASVAQALRQSFLDEYTTLCLRYKMILCDCLDRATYETYLDIKKVDEKTLYAHLKALKSLC